MEQDNEPPKVVLAFKVRGERVLSYLVAWGQGPQIIFETWKIWDYILHYFTA